MRYIKSFRLFEEFTGNNNENMHILIKDLIKKMKVHRLISVGDIKIDNAKKLIILTGLSSFWIRESSILGYYPGETNTFVEIIGEVRNELDVWTYNIIDQDLYDKSKDIIIKHIQMLNLQNVKGEEGRFHFPEFNLEDKEKRKEFYKSFFNTIRPEVISKVKDIWKDLDKSGVKENFRNPYIDKKAISNKKPEFIGDVSEPVEIRIDIEAVSHALDRQYRHGFSSGNNGKIEAGITKDEIIETVESAVEEITIALMQDKFDIYQHRDDYPTKGVKSGEPNRFVLRNKKTNLNIVCQLEPGDNEFKLTVITVIKKENFVEYRGQFVIEI